MIRQVLFDLRIWLRNGEQLLLMLLLPVGALLVGPGIVDRFGVSQQELADATIVVAFFATAFTGQSILTAFDRRANALLVIGAGPLGRSGFIRARIGTVFAACLIQAAFLILLAGILGYNAPLLAQHALVASIAIPAFVSCGLLLAGLLRAELVLGLANLLFVVGSMFGGTFSDFVWTPIGAIRALQHGIPLATPLLVILAWTMVAGITARRTFRWTD